MSKHNSIKTIKTICFIKTKLFSPGCSILWHMWWQRHTSHLRLKLQNTNANSFNLFFNLCSLFFSFFSHFTLFTSVHFNSLYFEALQRSMHSEGRKPGSLKRKALQFPEEQQKRPAKFAKRFAWRHLRVHLPATHSETITQLSPDYHPSWRSERGQLGWTGIYCIEQTKFQCWKSEASIPTTQKLIH